MMQQPVDSGSPRQVTSSPEYSPGLLEGGAEIDEFDRFLEGCEELASATHPSAIDYVLDVFDRASREGIEPTQLRVTAIIRSGFGTPEDVIERLSGSTGEELRQKYGDTLLQLLLAYAFPTDERT